jgi:DNA-binding MarR family transcriptional regulator
MTRWLEPAERSAWVRLAAVVERLPGLLEAQLTRDADLTHFEYWVLAMLSEAPRGTLRMSDLAGLTSATLPRLSHVVQRLEQRGLVERVPCPSDRRATNAKLTAAGRRKIVAAAPGHVEEVRELVIDALSPEQLAQLTEIMNAILERVGPAAIAGVERVDQQVGHEDSRP